MTTKPELKVNAAKTEHPRLRSVFSVAIRLSLPAAAGARRLKP
jgi:hypothetical protein